MPMRTVMMGQSLRRLLLAAAAFLVVVAGRSPARAAAGILTYMAHPRMDCNQVWPLRQVTVAAGFVTLRCEPCTG